MRLDRFINAFERLETPLYFYDLDILDQTLRLYTKILRKYGYTAHYAMKANANPRILEVIQRTGLGADCVSGNEVQLALDMGFDPQEIVYAGVGKSDKEIRTALQGGIFSFNCESVPEIKIISLLHFRPLKTTMRRYCHNISTQKHRASQLFRKYKTSVFHKSKKVRLNWFIADS